MVIKECGGPAFSTCAGKAEAGLTGEFQSEALAQRTHL